MLDSSPWKPKTSAGTMTFLLGCYAVLMIGVLPGAILLRTLSLPKISSRSLSLFLPLCFGLSLLVNYFLVLGLTLIHGYTPTVIRSIAVIEGLWVIGGYGSYWGKRDLSAIMAPQPGLLRKLALLLLSGFTLYWLSSFGHVFGYWDPSVSYNKWAIEWAGNHLPTLTWHYPQLLPTNWSLTYVMIGALPGGVHLEAFPATIQGFFLIGILLFFYDGFQHSKDQALLLGLMLFSVVMVVFFSPYLLSGYADIPVGFFNFGAIMLLWRASTQKPYYILSLLFALAAALTKPAGIYTAIAIPLLQYLWAEKRSLKRLCYQYLLLTMVIAPWYLYATLYETNQQKLGEVVFLTSRLIDENGLFGRFADFRLYGMIPLLLLMLAFVFKASLPQRFRQVLYLYMPYFFIWLCGFAYDPRNLIFLWPILALLVAMIVYHHPLFTDVLAWCKRKMLTAFPLWLIVVILVLLALGLSQTRYCDQRGLIAAQLTEKNKTYNPDVTDLLLDYSINPGFTGKILTNYVYFGDIPILTPYIVPFADQDYSTSMGPDVFQNVADLKAFTELHPDIQYLLLARGYQPELESPAFDAQLQKWQDNQQVILQFKLSQVEFYKINGSVQSLWSSAHS